MGACNMIAAYNFEIQFSNTILLILESKFFQQLMPIACYVFQSESIFRGGLRNNQYGFSLDKKENLMFYLIKIMGYQIKISDIAIDVGVNEAIVYINFKKMKNLFLAI